MTTTAQQRHEFHRQTLSLPNIIPLFVISFQGETYRLCNAFRKEAICWNGHTYSYLPITLENYRYSEDNASATPSLTLFNIAALYSSIISVLPNLIGAKVTFYLVYETQIAETEEAADSALYAFKHKFILSKKISSNYEKVIYQLDPVGFVVNSFAPSRLILRDGLFNMRFPGVTKKYAD